MKIKNQWEDLEFKILLEDNSWITQYTIPKNSQYSDTSTEWNLLNGDSTLEIKALN